MPRLFKLDHVQLAIPAGNEESARKFYVDELGFEEIPKPPELAARGGLWLKSDGVNLHLGIDLDFHPAKKAHPAFLCSGYDELLFKLRDYGIEVVAADDLFEGKAHCYVSDPFGNRLELIRLTAEMNS